MELVLTQPSTQPLNNKLYSAEEFNDVLCILQPASASAVVICEEIWNTSPKFILQYANAGLRADGTIKDDDDLEMIGGEDTQGATAYKEVIQADEQSTRIVGPGNNADHLPDQSTQQPRPDNLDIVLRTSAKVKDMISGFIFGRDGNKSDIVLRTGSPGDARISSVHFRIYLNQYGMLMLEDCSTNGTAVDDEHLGKKYRNNAKILTHGTTIELVTNANRETQQVERAKLVVKLPKRDDAQYRQNLKEYLNKIARYRHDRAQIASGALFPKPFQPENFMQIPVSGMATGTIQAPAQSPAMNLDLLTGGTAQSTLANGWSSNGKYRVLSELGKGAFAMVYKITTTNGGEPQAAKRIDRAGFLKNGQQGKLMSELEIMQKVDHPHVIHFYDYDLTSKYLFIVMEYMPCGDLAPYARADGYLGLAILKSITRQMLHALAYIHRNSIVHRDIKPENILVQSKDPFLVKLSDFGLSKVIEKDEVGAVTFCGTLLYCAPEIYPDYETVRERKPRVKRKSSAPKPYSSAVDIWSLGTVLYHLITSKPPFKGSGEDQGYKMLRAVIFDDLDYDSLMARDVDNHGIEMLNKMIDIDGEYRSSAVELLFNPWLESTADVVPIPNLWESQMIGVADSPPLETLEEEDECEEPNSRSFVDAAAALMGPPTPDAPSLTAGETSAEDKNPITENEYSDGNSQADVQIPLYSSSHYAEDDFGSHRSSEPPYTSDPPGSAYQRQGWKAYFGQNQQAEDPASASEDDTPKQAHPQRLFGEISQDPYQESGVFGNVQPPVIQHQNASPSTPVRNSPSLFGTESKMNKLNMKVSKGNLSILRSAVTNSMQHGKRHRSVAASGSDESNTSSMEEPAAKRSMRAGMDPKTIEDPSRPGVPAVDPEVNDMLSQGVDKLQILGQPLGRLTPLEDCLSDKVLTLTVRLSCFGRSSSNTHIWEDKNDSRIPRSAFTIYFYSPGMTDTRNVAWHNYPNLHAVVLTLSSTGIKVNGVHIPQSIMAEKAFKIAKLRTGDTIEVYKKSTKLIYKCQFNIGESRHSRGENEEILVEDNHELYETASLQLSNRAEQATERSTMPAKGNATNVLSAIAP